MIVETAFNVLTKLLITMHNDSQFQSDIVWGKNDACLYWVLQGQNTCVMTVSRAVFVCLLLVMAYLLFYTLRQMELFYTCLQDCASYECKDCKHVTKPVNLKNIMITWLLSCFYCLLIYQTCLSWGSTRLLSCFYCILIYQTCLSWGSTRLLSCFYCILIYQTCLSWGSTTAVGSLEAPILHVDVGWYTVWAKWRIRHSKYSSVPNSMPLHAATTSSEFTSTASYLWNMLVWTIFWHSLTAET